MSPAWARLVRDSHVKLSEKTSSINHLHLSDAKPNRSLDLQLPTDRLLVVSDPYIVETSSTHCDALRRRPIQCVHLTTDVVAIPRKLQHRKSRNFVWNSVNSPNTKPVYIYIQYVQHVQARIMTNGRCINVWVQIGSTLEFTIGCRLPYGLVTRVVCSSG